MKIAIALISNILALFLASSAFAAPLPTVPPALMSELLAFAKPLVRTLTRPVAVYHWTHRSDVKIPIQGGVDHTDPRFNQYLLRRYNSFYRPDPRNRSVLGAGLYLAIDPVVTRSYGGRNWVLYQLEFKKGARYLDILYRTSDFSPELQGRLSTFGCPAWSLRAIFEEDSTAACQAIRVSLAQSKELNVVAARYDYGAGQLKSCAQAPQVAFVAWNGAGFDMSRSVPFIAEIPANDPIRNYRILLQSLFDDSSYPIPSGPTPTQNLHPYLTLRDLSPGIKVQDWARKYIMGCSGKYPEDAIQ